MNTQRPSVFDAQARTGTLRTLDSLPHAHSVQFYGEDSFLLDELRRFVGTALLERQNGCQDFDC
jgi:hypothetical protein